MDKKQLIKWTVPIVARGLAWALAVWLGMTAAQAGDAATKIASSIGTMVLVGVSVWTSVTGRKKLLATPPPGTVAKPKK